MQEDGDGYRTSVLDPEPLVERPAQPGKDQAAKHLSQQLEPDIGAQGPALLPAREQPAHAIAQCRGRRAGRPYGRPAPSVFSVTVRIS